MGFFWHLFGMNPFRIGDGIWISWNNTLVGYHRETILRKKVDADGNQLIDFDEFKTYLVSQSKQNLLTEHDTMIVAPDVNDDVHVTLKPGMANGD